MVKRFIAALLLVVVAGCSSDPAPKQPKPSTSPTPTVVAPTMPAQAKENSDEGAAAFVDHYIDVLNYASSTGDVEELSRLSDPKCSGCQKYIELYRKTYASGARFSGGEWSPGNMLLDFGDSETYVTTTVRVAASEHTKGDKKTRTDASSTKVSFGIGGDPWTVTQLGLGDPE